MSLWRLLQFSRKLAASGRIPLKMDDTSLSSESQVSIASKSSGRHQPRPPDEPKPAYQRFGRSLSNTGKVVRAPHIRTEKIYSIKKRKFSSDGHSLIERGSRDDDGVEREGAAWNHTRPAQAPHPSMSTFLQSLMKTPTFKSAIAPSGSKKTHPTMRGVVSRALHERRYTAGSLNARSAVSTSGDMDAIQLRDEVVELKKLMNAVIKERDLAKMQQIKLSKELLRKDAQIEDLLKSGHISTHDAKRSLVKTAASKTSVPRSSSSSDSGSMAVTSLKQKIHALEQTLRKREDDINDFKRSIGNTQLNEMKVELEVYLAEIARLNRLLHKQSVKVVDGQLAVTPRSGREASVKLSALNKATVKMAAELESLEEENKSLKQKLEKFNSSYTCNPSGLTLDPKEVGMRGSLADGYEDYNRAQMLSAIVNLELQCSEFQNTVRTLEKEKAQGEILHEQKLSEIKKDLAISHEKFTAAQHGLAVSHETEIKLKGIIRRLKEDRVHYRNESEKTQNELSSTKTVLEKKEITHHKTAMELQDLKQLQENERTALEHARKLARKSSRPACLTNERKESAAIVIQCSWRKYTAKGKQEKFQQDVDDATIDVQSVFRGHLARKQLLVDSANDNMNSDACRSDLSDSSIDTELIQSSVKGFLARRSTLRAGMNPMSSDSGTRNSLYPLTSDISSTFDVMKTSPYYSVEPCQKYPGSSQSIFTQRLSNNLMSASVHRHCSSESNTYSDPEEQFLKDELL